MSETDNGKPVLTSNELRIAVLVSILAWLQATHGVSLEGMTPEILAVALLQAGVFAMGLVRVFWTKVPINWKKLL